MFLGGSQLNLTHKKYLCILEASPHRTFRDHENPGWEFATKYDFKGLLNQPTFPVIPVAPSCEGFSPEQLWQNFRKDEEQPGPGETEAEAS